MTNYLTLSVKIPVAENDFHCSMDWRMKSYKEADHQPVAAFHGDENDTIIRITGRPGERIPLGASVSDAPDGDPMEYCWWIYEEAGTCPGDVDIDNANQPKANVTIPTGRAAHRFTLSSR